MKSASYFRAFSYSMIAFAMLSLVLAGGLSYGLATLFLVVMVLSWNLEHTRWQLPERVGLAIVLLSVPLFYLDWRYQSSLQEPIERLGVNALAHLIVFLSAVKLLQVKKDRDWVFLYLITFFEVLLAAGLSFSPVFLLTLTLYLLSALSAITAFEIQKARRTLKPSETRLLVPPDSRVFKRSVERTWRHGEGVRLPFVAAALLVLILILALPLFLIAPRAGAAALTRSGGGLSNFIGFSENVRLGEIGTLKKDDEVVMRVRIEGPQPPHDLRWRGVALDEFTGRGWKKSIEARHSVNAPNDRGFFQIYTPEALHRLTSQTFFLEPMETQVLFAASRAVAVQGDLPFVRVDEERSLQSRRHEFERVIYRVISDTGEGPPETLRTDQRPYPQSLQRYLQLPDALDVRVVALAANILVNAHARNRYDAAKAIESALQTAYGYSLEMKASGDDPLSDFLFNVKSGHCEYFATAMAVMLRTQGVATRIVNGFLPGEYNETAGAYTVRQSDAHSWVEVYFPESRSWVTFDPTPSAGKTEPVRSGFAGQLGKYAEALELVWLQYVVGYDKQEQQSLATSLHNQLFDVGKRLAAINATIKVWLPARINPWLIGLVALAVLAMLVYLGRRLSLRGLRARSTRQEDSLETSHVVFYERLLAALARRGLKRDGYLTPLEFADSIGLGEAALVTRAYNRVRFGGEQLSSNELREVNKALMELENQD